MSSNVLKKLQAFVPTIDDTVGNLGPTAPVAPAATVVVASAKTISEAADTPDADPIKAEVSADANADSTSAAKRTAPTPTARPTKSERRRVSEALPGMPRTPLGSLDGRSLRRTGRTLQFSVKLRPELPEAMKIAAYEAGIGLGELIEDMWAAYEHRRQGQNGRR